MDVPHTHTNPHDSNALPLPQLVEARLAGDPKLTDGVKSRIREALGDSEDAGESHAHADPVYLGKVTVTGFRGVGSEARLNLRPKPGVTLVVGRNGSGKSSIAEAIETLFTGTNAHCAGQHPNRIVRWRNLHRGAKLLCLRHYAGPAPARRVSALWSALSTGCKYHHDELGPNHAQVRAWQTASRRSSRNSRCRGRS